MTSKQRIIMTGSSGAIGRAVVAALIKSGKNVISISRKETGSEAVAGVRTLVGDIRKPEELRAHIAESDVICHLAAFIPPDFSDSSHARACFETNALATLRLAEIACEQKKRFIYTSSGSIYAPSAVPVVETAPIYPEHHAPYYLGSKLLGELYVEHLRETRGLDSTILRVSSVYGAGLTRTVVAKFVSDAIAGRPLRVFHEGKNRVDFVYVDDIARLVVSAVDGPQQGVFNAGSGTATSILGLAEIVREMFAEHDPWIEKIQPAGKPPPSFPALSMDRTSRAFSHTPTSLKAGLTAIKKVLAESGPNAQS
jgi:UDP-glucose 4-epimerase